MTEDSANKETPNDFSVHGAESQTFGKTAQQTALFENVRWRAKVLLICFAILLVAFVCLWLLASQQLALTVWGIGMVFLFVGSIFLFRDMEREDQKKAKRIRDRDTRYRQTLALMPEGVVILSENWTIDWINAKATEHFGITPQSVGKGLFEAFDDKDFQAWLCAGNYDKRFSLSRGKRLYEVAVVAPDVRHALIVSHDVTERRQIDDMRREFVANVSHELRTPLTVISGFLEAEIDKKNVSPELEARHRELMLDQTRRMKTLLEDLLTLSTLESHDTPSVEEPVVIAMPKLVDDVVKEGRALSNDQHTIVTHIEDVSLIGQPEEIRSAAMNLLSNAIRYTPAGGTIEVTWKREGTGAIYSVKDTGIGIDAKHLPRLTERFYRVDKGRSRATGGTGLGLAIVKHILRRNGGELEVQSTLGKGSTFTIRFPESRVFALNKS